MPLFQKSEGGVASEAAVPSFEKELHEYAGDSVEGKSTVVEGAKKESGQDEGEGAEVHGEAEGGRGSEGNGGEAGTGGEGHRDEEEREGATKGGTEGGTEGSIEAVGKVEEGGREDLAAEMEQIAKQEEKRESRQEWIQMHVHTNKEQVVQRKTEAGKAEKALLGLVSKGGAAGGSAKSGEDGEGGHRGMVTFDDPQKVSIGHFGEAATTATATTSTAKATSGVAEGANAIGESEVDTSAQGPPSVAAMREQFKEVVLIISLENARDAEESVPFLRDLYGRIFQRLLFVAPQPVEALGVKVRTVRKPTGPPPWPMPLPPCRCWCEFKPESVISTVVWCWCWCWFNPESVMSTVIPSLDAFVESDNDNRTQNAEDFQTEE